MLIKIESVSLKDIVVMRMKSSDKDADISMHLRSIVDIVYSTVCNELGEEVRRASIEHWEDAKLRGVV